MAYMRYSIYAVAHKNEDQTVQRIYEKNI